MRKAAPPAAARAEVPARGKTCTAARLLLQHCVLYHCSIVRRLRVHTAPDWPSHDFAQINRVQKHVGWLLRHAVDTSMKRGEVTRKPSTATIRQRFKTITPNRYQPAKEYDHDVNMSLSNPLKEGNLDNQHQIGDAPLLLVSNLKTILIRMPLGAKLALV